MLGTRQATSGRVSDSLWHNLISGCSYQMVDPVLWFLFVSALLLPRSSLIRMLKLTPTAPHPYMPPHPPRHLSPWHLLPPQHLTHTWHATDMPHTCTQATHMHTFGCHGYHTAMMVSKQIALPLYTNHCRRI